MACGVDRPRATRSRWFCGRPRVTRRRIAAARRGPRCGARPRGPPLRRPGADPPRAPGARRRGAGRGASSHCRSRPGLERAHRSGARECRGAPRVGSTWRRSRTSARGRFGSGSSARLAGSEGRFDDPDSRSARSATPCVAGEAQAAQRGARLLTREAPGSFRGSQAGPAGEESPASSGSVPPRAAAPLRLGFAWNRSTAEQNRGRRPPWASSAPASQQRPAP